MSEQNKDSSTWTKRELAASGGPLLQTLAVPVLSNFSLNVL